MQPKQPPPRPRGLRYIGPGSLTGIPARDLSPDDIERLARSPYIQRRYSGVPATLVTLLAGVQADGRFLYRPLPSTDAKE